MKKTLLLTAIIFATLFNVNAQTKIYDFPFAETLSSTVGSGTFSSGGFTTATRTSSASTALSLNSTTTVEATLSNLPIGSNRRTVSLWFNRQGGGNVGLFSYGAQANLEIFGIYFATNGGLVFQGFGTGNDKLLEIGGVSYQKWHHLAVMYTGTNVKIYFNGNLTNTFARSLNTGNGNFKLGNMVGYYDDLKIYNDTLTDSQVTELFENNDISKTTSIAKNTLNNNILVYPNPVITTLNIDTKENVDIEIINLLGVKVAVQKLYFGNNQIDVRNLTNGIYFICNNNGGKLKFIKVD